MKLKTNNAAKSPENLKKNKSFKKKSKGVEVKKEKLKEVVKPSVLKKSGENSKVEVSSNPFKILQQDLWFKAIDNVSKKTNLSDVESNIVKLLSDYKSKSSVPQKKIKFQNFILKGFSKYKDTSGEIIDGLHDKLLEEFTAVGGNTETKVEKSEKNTVKVKPSTKPVKEASDDEEIDIGDDDEEDDVDDEEADDDAESIELGDSDDDVEEESEEEKPKPKAKGNNKNGKNQPNKGKNGSKFQSGKVQKNKKFGKKK